MLAKSGDKLWMVSYCAVVLVAVYAVTQSKALIRQSAGKYGRAKGWKWEQAVPYSSGPADVPVWKAGEMVFSCRCGQRGMQIHPSHFHKAPSVLARVFNNITVLLVPLRCTEWGKHSFDFPVEVLCVCFCHPMGGTYILEERGTSERNIFNAAQKTGWHFPSAALGDSDPRWAFTATGGLAQHQTFSDWICVSLGWTQVRQRVLFQGKSAKRVLLKPR